MVNGPRKKPGHCKTLHTYVEPRNNVYSDIGDNVSIFAKKLMLQNPIGTSVDDLNPRPSVMKADTASNAARAIPQNAYEVLHMYD